MKEFNQKIQKLGKDYSNLIKGVPFQFPKLNKNPDILFIGINPSHRKNSRESASYQESEENEKRARKNRNDPYFKPFYRFTNNWEHIDLFFIRETNQNKLKKHIEFKEKNGKMQINEFGKKQLEISFSIMDWINPKVIIVNNALASKIIKERFNINGVDENKGYNVLGNIPIFFSGMLSGRRSLDKGSFDRLIWHVKKALNSV